MNIQSSSVPGCFAVKSDGVGHIDKAVAVDEFILSRSASGKGESHFGVDDEVVHE